MARDPHADPDMESVTGIFTNRADAEAAARGLRALGIPPERITVLAPEQSAATERIPTTEAEPPGLGRALGAVVGGAAGAAGGIQAGALASVFVPGVGPVAVLGALGALLLGVGGAAVGAAFDHGLREGLPKDEVYVYEDALRQGRSVVVALADDAEQASSARTVLARDGAESIDAARERWWLGLRDAEAAAYVGEDRDFIRDEANYRRGFEAALSVGGEGAAYGDVVDELKRRYPEIYGAEAFRRGYERGCDWIAWRRTRGRAA
jgi:hypothetical protein